MRYFVVDNKDDVYGDFSCDGHAYEWIEYLNVRYPGRQFRIMEKEGRMTELTGTIKELDLASEYKRIKLGYGHSAHGYARLRKKHPEQAEYIEKIAGKSLEELWLYNPAGKKEAANGSV